MLAVHWPGKLAIIHWTLIVLFLPMVVDLQSGLAGSISERKTRSDGGRFGQMNIFLQRHVNPSLIMAGQ